MTRLDVHSRRQHRLLLRSSYIFYSLILSEFSEPSRNLMPPGACLCRRWKRHSLGFSSGLQRDRAPARGSVAL